jgi:hypothetical protein
VKILIIGRGITGSTLYYLFREKGHQVYVIESGFRKFYPTLIHSLLLRGKDIDLALDSLDFYRSHNVPLFSYPSYTIGKIPSEVFDDWLTRGFEVRELYVDWLNTSAIEGKKTDRLVGVKNFVDSVPYSYGNAYVDAKGRIFINKEKEVSGKFDIIILSSGAWNSVSTSFKLPLKSYYCWAWAVLTPKRELDKVFIYDYELGFYSRPVLGIGSFLAIIGDGDTIECSPFTPQAGDKRAVEAAGKRLGPLVPFYKGEGYCEGTPDMRPVYGQLTDKIYYIGGLNGYGAEVGPGLARLLFRFIIEGEEDKDYSASRFNGVTEFKISKEPHEF